MPNPFVTPDKILDDNNKFTFRKNQTQDDGFFIDKKYQSSLTLLVSEKKIKIFFLLTTLVFFLLASRVFYLQVLKSDEYRLVADGNRVRQEIVPSPRGIIYDCSGKPLVSNIPRFNLLMEKKDFENDLLTNDLLDKISRLTNWPSEQIQNKISELEKNKSPENFVFELNYQQAMKYLSDADNFLPLKLEINSYREYDNAQNSLSHVLGYLGKINEGEWESLKKENYQFTDLVGKSGLELIYEQELRGMPGKTDYEVDASGKFVKTLNKIEGHKGNDLTLSIDYEFNLEINKILDKVLDEYGFTKAAVVASQPQTGEILALVSWPNFNNNFFNYPAKFGQELESFLTDENQPLFNRVVSGEYPSGSTIKPLIAIAGLEEKLINEWTTILSVGGIHVDKWFFPDWQAGGHGTTNVTKALAQSVNTFFYYLGGGYENFKGLGLENINKYAGLFGFGSKSGIDLPGEASGFLPTREWKKEVKNEDWYIGDTYHLSIGQGDFLSTPLQINNLFSIVANGGIFYKPHFIKKIYDVVYDKEKNIQPQVIEHDFVEAQNIEIVRKGLRQAVTDGSARALSNLKYAVAAKTGTAQVGGEAEPHAWLSAFGPYDNPNIVLTVLVENGEEGSKVATVIAREILAWYFDNRLINNQ